MRTPTGYEQYAATHLRRPDGTVWASSSGSFCVQLVYEAGGFTGASFDDASEAAYYAQAHHDFDSDYRTAQRGEFHYWVTGAGHVALETGHGSALMASTFASSLAPGLGYLPITTYGVPVGHGHTYLGHSPYFRDHTLASEVDPSGGGGTPVPVPVPKENDVIQISVNDSTGKYSPAKSQWFAQVGGLAWAPYTDTTQANRIAAYLGQPTAFACTYAEWEFYMLVSGGTNPIAYTAPAAGGGGASAAQVQAITDAQTTVINTNLSALWTSISGAFTTIAGKFLPLATTAQVAAIPASSGATLQQTTDLVAQSTADIISKIPTKLVP